MMLIIRDLGLQDYQDTFLKMQSFTQNRDEHTLDEIWILEHHPVYTQGQAGKPEHILNRNLIPIVQSDRGGQVTYHGPGQLVVYFLLNCQRQKLSIKQLVSGIEGLIIDTLDEHQITGHRICGAPGIYVNQQKIASLGLRIKNHCSYHGLALNVDMDLKPFLDINPCGFEKLVMTQMKEHNPETNFEKVINSFKRCLMRHIQNDRLFQDMKCNISTNSSIG
jgi:lipoyl(octanoyl) transferase